MLIASPAGGVDIEDVAENSPELVKKIPLDIYEGISDEIALDVAKFLNFDGPLASMVIIINTTYKLNVIINVLFYLQFIGGKRNKKIMGIFFVG